MNAPKILLLDEPTKGVDVGTRHEIYRLIVDLAETGVGLIVVSSELEEVIGLADRSLVIADGRIVGELSRAEVERGEGAAHDRRGTSGEERRAARRECRMIGVPATDTFSVAGKVILVTGAATGIGRATSELLVSLGARVVGIGLDVADGARLADALSARIGFPLPRGRCPQRRRGPDRGCRNRRHRGPARRPRELRRRKSSEQARRGRERRGVGPDARRQSRRDVQGLPRRAAGDPSRR